ncbi:AGE family epimerase/isomerase [Aquabacter sp. L1I39]|uniref:AGE family epimerase/isomerase n=1 Tax=Aquabacter sp. L1I39 TaxID=2820278 RepID=UPI001ADABB82|nr:AGE family epimerase/isomerase [Aquabacter sp. L1I39]QTL03039.1 AGE family epimerase/isomerase [Aquabacter sp. L1I39]
MSKSFQAARDEFRAFLFESALPLWAGRGVDREAGGFVERLTADGVPTADPRRARVVGRQIFAFATAERRAWPGPARNIVRHGLAALEGQHLDAQGRIVSIVEAGGRALSREFDLYDHAFVLFGLAAAHEVGERPTALSARAETLLSAMQPFRHPERGFEEAIPRSLPLKANPHMHMLEASLAWRQMAVGTPWDALADELAELCLDRFLDPETGALKEFYDGDWKPLTDHAGSVVEPGHQFEWAWLLTRWGTLRARPDALAAARRLLDVAEARGVDPRRDLAINELNADLSVRDDRARLWPQTERIKAHTLMAALAVDDTARKAALDRAARALRGLMRFFVHPVRGAWWEHIDAEGRPMLEPSRASSLYHIMCAFDVVEDYARRSTS